MNEEHIAVPIIVGALSFTLLYRAIDFNSMLNIGYNPNLVLSFLFGFLVSGVIYKTLINEK